MVDLSQNQPQKQEPTSNAPASDKPPVTQPDEPSVIPTPGEPSKPPDDISTPPIKDIKDEEKIDSPEQEEIKKELSELGISPQGGSKKTRVILAALGVFFLVATLPAAVYLVKQRQEIRKEAAGTPHNFTSSDWTVGGPELKGTHANHEVTVGPGPIDFVASGFGMRNHTEGTIRLEIPEGASIEKVFAFWAGQKTVSRDRTDRRDQFCECRMNEMAGKLNQDAKHCQVGIGKAGGSRTIVYPDKWNIFVHDNPPNCCNGQDPDNPSDSCKSKISDRNCSAYGAYFADVTSVIKQKFPGNPNVLDINVGDMYFYSYASGGGGEGMGIVLVYKKQGLPEAKVKVKLWGQFIIRARTNKMTFSLSDIDTSTSNEIKSVFFFNEAEAETSDEGAYSLRPNYLYYNGQNLAPTDNTPFVGYSVEDPYSPSAKTNNNKWWDTRITGVNLPKITYQEGAAAFDLWSPNKGQAPDYPGKMGDSLGLVGGAIKYTTGPAPEPPGCWDECESGDCSAPLTCAIPPGDTVQRCVVHPDCPSEQTCVCPLTVCLDLTSVPSAETLEEGSEAQFTCKGSSGVDKLINHVEFKLLIDDVEQDLGDLATASATKTNGEYEGSINYTVPKTGSSRVECRVCTSENSTECTQWGEVE